MASLVSWLLGIPKKNEETINEESEITEEETDPQSPEDQDVVENVSGTGVISLLDDCIAKGVIDGTYLFDKEEFKQLKLKRGMAVNYTAVTSKSSSCWTVTHLEPIISEKHKAIADRAKHLAVNYKVIEIHDKYVTLSRGRDDSPISLVNSWLPKDYPVREGDWLEVRLKAVEDEHTASGGEVSQANILAVSWTEQTVAVGKVALHRNRMCINGIISFTLDVVEHGQMLKVDDRVRFVAVASDQEYEPSNQNGGKRSGVYIFKKRACSITFFQKQQLPQSHFESLKDSESEWIEEEQLDDMGDNDRFDELFRDKGGIRIRPSKQISFKPLPVGESSVPKIVEVDNTNSSNKIVLKSITLANCQDVCTFQLDLGKTEGNAITILLPHNSYSFKITCIPKQLGRTKEICIFDFGDFQIGRWLVVTALSDNEAAIKSMRHTFGARDYRKDMEQVEIESMTMLHRRNMKLIRGPTAVKTPFFLPHRIPANSVPRNILKVYENATPEDLKRAYPKMNLADWTVLNAENYLTRFQVSLWFEEIENDNQRRRYDMRNVTMRVVGECLVFDVAGLSEFYPPVLQGDPIKCAVSKESKYIYDGYVQKIVSSESSETVSQVFAKFNEAFHRNYNGSPVIIQFCLGRTSFKRQHFAINHAMEYLGSDWLFPEILILKPPRIHFVEDPNDNVRHVQSHSAKEVTKSVKMVQLSNKERVGIRAPSLRGPLQNNVQDPIYLGMVKLRWFNNDLNEEQKNAVRRILTGSCRPLPYIIFGPPGTGKTVTVVETILQIYHLERSSRILVTVPSNAGADVIAEHLVATNLFTPGDFVRLNGFIRSEVAVPETIAAFCMDGEYLDSVAKHRLIISTVTTAGQFFQLNLNTGHFSHVFIDEAGYCTEPEAMIASVLAAVAKEGQIILAGDPKQLGPVLTCDLSVNRILSVSFLERLMNTSIYARNEAAFPDTKYNPSVLTKLVKSYRAHEMLLKVPSEMFYEDELVSCASYADSYELCEKLDFLPKKGVPLIFHGCQGTCLQDNDSPSWYNLSEVSQIVKYLKLLRCNGILNEEIGIITPYRKQVEKLKIALRLHLLEDDLPKIASVQEFQGGERKVMIISTVRSDSEELIQKKLSRFDFLYSKKRFNVAVTRAKALMIIVGNPHVLRFNTCWNKLLCYAVDLGVYVGCNLPRKLDRALKELLDNVNNNPQNLNNNNKNLTASEDCEDQEEIETADLFG